MVRHPATAGAHTARGGSTRAFQPRTDISAAQPRMAEPGGLAVGQASGQQVQDGRSASHRRRARGWPRVLQRAQKKGGGNWCKDKAESQQRNIRRSGGAWCSQRRSPKKRQDFVRNAFGRWIRWSPPAPKTQEKTLTGGIKTNRQREPSRRMQERHEQRRAKMNKLQAAEVQLKKKVKALDRKVTDLQQYYSRREQALIREFKELLMAMPGEQRNCTPQVQVQQVLTLAASVESRPADIDRQQFQDYCSRFKYEVHEGGFCQGCDHFDCPLPPRETGYPESTTGTFYSSDVFHRDKDFCESCMFEYYRRIDCSLV